MYGYIRPNRGELRVKDYERFQAAYCGLCHSLARRHGFLTRFAVSYDLTFLALLLYGGQGCTKRCFCPAHPFRRRRCLCCDTAMDVCADLTILFAWWKLEDQLRDGGFWAHWGARLGKAVLRRAYEKSRRAQPAFAAAAEERLGQLDKLEREGSGDLDRCAECVAGTLAVAADAAAPALQRPLRELLYHIGRCIYILDAADDFDGDLRAGRYNPLLCRYGEELGAAERESICQTLNLSQQQAVRALFLLPKGPNDEILENIVTTGLPQVFEMVLSGRWRQRKKLSREYSRRTWSENV